jgi:uncharacterized protein (DUF1778 family)
MKDKQENTKLLMDALKQNPNRKEEIRKAMSKL